MKVNKLIVSSLIVYALAGNTFAQAGGGYTRPLPTDSNVATMSIEKQIKLLDDMMTNPPKAGVEITIHSGPTNTQWLTLKESSLQNEINKYKNTQQKLQVDLENLEKKSIPERTPADRANILQTNQKLARLSAQITTAENELGTITKKLQSPTQQKFTLNPHSHDYLQQIRKIQENLHDPLKYQNKGKLFNRLHWRVIGVKFLGALGAVGIASSVAAAGIDHQVASESMRGPTASSRQQ